MTTIHNPVIPYVMSLPGGRMQAGTVIIIHGQPLYNCNRFCVSLISGPQPERDDIVFRLSAHFDTYWLVRNSKLNQEWGAEEGASPRKFPFRRQQPFVIEIYTSPSAYVIAVDGRHYCEYVHRVPYSEADTFQITGDVQISMVEFKNSNAYPTFPPSNRLNVSNPSLPFHSLINGHFAVGNEVQVHGRVNPHPNRFHVNLQQGCQTFPQPTVVFHFNPRYEGGNRIVVMNTFMGQWATEQRINQGRHLQPGSTFVLIIRRQPSHFEVLVNGSRMTTFNHRMIADIVDSVSIEGDVSVSKVVVI